MKKNCIIITVFLLLAVLSGKLSAQQYPLYSLYMFNPSIINPAYAATSNKTTAMAQSRIQWMNFEGAPVTNLVTFIKPLPFLNSGLSFSVMNDVAGPVNHSAFYADYSYSFNVASKSKISLGLRGGFKYYMVNLSNLSTVQDPVFSHDQESSLLPAFSFGAFYYGHNFYAGISIPELVKTVNIYEGNSSGTLLPIEERHLLISGGYVLYVEKYSLVLKPTFLGRFVYGAPAVFDIGFHTVFKDKLWLGFNYRLHDCVTPFMQVQLNNKFRLAYSYDYSLGEIRRYNAGTHEIGIIYELDSGIDKILSPRYF